MKKKTEKRKRKRDSRQSSNQEDGNTRRDYNQTKTNEGKRHPKKRGTELQCITGGGYNYYGKKKNHPKLSK